METGVSKLAKTAFFNDVTRSVVQWRHQLWGTGACAPLELVQVVIFTLHVCSVAFPVHVLILQTHFRCSQKRS